MSRHGWRDRVRRAVGRVGTTSLHRLARNRKPTQRVEDCDEKCYNYALADYVTGLGRPEPLQPQPLSPPWSICLLPPPSAGGPGSGLFNDVGFAVSALEDFGVFMPDGEPDDLQTAADVWEEFASASGVGNLPALLDTLTKSFESEVAPEVAHIDEDIRELKLSAERVLVLYRDLAASCRAHRESILEFRTQLGQQVGTYSRQSTSWMMWWRRRAAKRLQCEASSIP